MAQSDAIERGTGSRVATHKRDQCGVLHLSIVIPLTVMKREEGEKACVSEGCFGIVLEFSLLKDEIC